MRSIVLTVPSDATEIASDRLWVAGARAVEERTAPDGRVELWSTLGSDDEKALLRLGVTPTDWSVEFVDVDQRPADTWRQFARPIEVNDRLILQPTWLDIPPRADALTVRIDPGGAFGLGDHPTTRLAASAADELVSPGDHVLDVGSGSGVLSVIAAKRGAARVVAVDISDAAREATVDNAIRNDVAELIAASTTAVDDVVGTFDVVLANILAPALVSMSASLRRLTAPTGSLVVSGVLTGCYEHVVDALRPMIVADVSNLDGWSAVTLLHEQR